MINIKSVFSLVTIILITSCQSSSKKKNLEIFRNNFTNNENVALTIVHCNEPIISQNQIMNSLLKTFKNFKLERGREFTKENLYIILVKNELGEYRLVINSTNDNRIAYNYFYKVKKDYYRYVGRNYVDNIEFLKLDKMIKRNCK